MIVLAMLSALSAVASNTRTVCPEVDSVRVLKNPLSGWVMYLNRGWDGDFWEKSGYDGIDAAGGRKLNVSDYASVAYIRTSWSSMEPEEGRYFWTDENSRLSRLLSSAQSRGLKLAFRIVVDGRDQGQNTPLYVRDAGAEGFYNEIRGVQCFTPYADDPVFQHKYAKFIHALAERFNDADEVDFIDAYGLGKWGEGHAVVYKDPANKEAVFDWITSLYAESFTRVPLFVHYHRLIGDSNKNSWGPVAPESERMLAGAIAKGYSLRHDAFGMTDYYQQWEKDYACAHNFQQPILMEGGWITGAHHRYWRDSSQRYRENHPEDVREGEYEISAQTHVNMMDLRAGNETFSWFLSEDSACPGRSLVEKVVTNCGYRLYPTSLSYNDVASHGKGLDIEHCWTNMGWGYCPTNIRQMDQRYKVAFALLDSKGKVCSVSVDGNTDLSKWLRGNKASFKHNMPLDGVGKGKYTLAVALVDVWKGNKPAIDMSVARKNLTDTGWLVLGRVKVK